MCVKAMCWLGLGGRCQHAHKRTNAPARSISVSHHFFSPTPQKQMMAITDRTINQHNRHTDIHTDIHTYIHTSCNQPNK